MRAGSITRPAGLVRRLREAGTTRPRPSRFTYKANPGDECLGFVAEDVPDLVATADRKGLSPMDIVAVLTKVVQQQQAMLEEQQTRIAALEARLGR